MSSSASYGKISTSGLTFAYDIGEIFNSYKGESTTNLLSYSEYQYLADGYTEALGGWDTHEGTMLIDVANKVPGFTNRSIKMSCVNANVYKYHFSAVLTNGQTYTISFWAKAQNAGNYDNFMLADGPGGYLIVQPSSITTVTTEFTRVKHTFSMATRDTGTYNFATYLYGNGQVVWLTGFQLENKSQATRYLPSNGTPATRSSTQGLLDLTGNNEINIGSVSFTNDNKEEIIFDGTDDYIGLPNGLMQGTGNFTVNQIIKCDAGVVGGTTFGSYPSGPLQIFYGNTYMGMWLDNNSTYVASPVPFTTNTVMITATRNGSITKFYQNGELLKTGSVSSSVGSSGTLFRIGSNTVGSERFAGKIFTTHVYNRELSETEIRNNFIQLADRYNITIKDGSTQALAAPSAQYLADIGIKANGVYWINNGTTTKQTYCEFKNGEGWMLVMNVKSDYFGDTYLTWNNYDNWINDGDELGNPQFPYVGSGHYRNRDIFRYYPTTKWMIKVHNNGNEFGDGSWAAWQINSTYSGQTFKQIMNIPGATGGGTQISNTYYAQQGMGRTTYNRGLDYCSISRTLGHLRVNHLLNNNGCRILGSEQTLETANTDVTRGIGTHYAIEGSALTNTQNEWNGHVSPYVDGNYPYTADRRQFTDNIFPDNSNANTATYQGENYNPSLTYGGTPAMVAYYHYGIFIK